jgi:hypothetical protein
MSFSCLSRAREGLTVVLDQCRIHREGYTGKRQHGELSIGSAGQRTGFVVARHGDGVETQSVNRRCVVVVCRRRQESCEVS